MCSCIDLQTHASSAPDDPVTSDLLFSGSMFIKSLPWSIYLPTLVNLLIAKAVFLFTEQIDLQTDTHRHTDTHTHAQSNRRI